MSVGTLKNVAINFVFQFFGANAEGCAVNTYGIINAVILVSIGFAAGKLF